MDNSLNKIKIENGPKNIRSKAAEKYIRNFVIKSRNKLKLARINEQIKVCWRLY